jgi:hypothetical protein
MVQLEQCVVGRAELVVPAVWSARLLFWRQREYAFFFFFPPERMLKLYISIPSDRFGHHLIPWTGAKPASLGIFLFSPKPTFSAASSFLIRFQALLLCTV